MFVGQRKDRFVVNLGETFDLVNIKYPAEELAPGVGGSARALAPNTLADANVTSLALEIPASCLTAGSEPVIGGWTTASVRQAAILNPAPQSDKSVASVGAVSSADRPGTARRCVGTGVAAGRAIGQRAGDRTAGQGSVQCLAAEG